jgi:hypothetical protein
VTLGFFGASDEVSKIKAILKVLPPVPVNLLEMFNKLCVNFPGDL